MEHFAIVVAEDGVIEVHVVWLQKYVEWSLRLCLMFIWASYSHMGNPQHAKSLLAVHGSIHTSVNKDAFYC